jgi:hypothetical protein
MPPTEWCLLFPPRTCLSAEAWAAWATFAASLLAAFAAALAVFASFKVAQSQARIAADQRQLDFIERRAQSLLVAREAISATAKAIEACFENQNVQREIFLLERLSDCSSALADCVRTTVALDAMPLLVGALTIAQDAYAEAAAPEKNWPHHEIVDTHVRRLKGLATTVDALIATSGYMPDTVLPEGMRWFSRRAGP